MLIGGLRYFNTPRALLQCITCLSEIKRSRIKVINVIKLIYEMCYNSRTDEIRNNNKHKVRLFNKNILS